MTTIRWTPGPGPVSRALAVLSAGLFAVLGLTMLLAPVWSAERFAWAVSPFVVATMGGWSIGNAVIAVLNARTPRWSTTFPTVLYLGLFGFGQLAVLTAFRDRLRLDHPLAWLYVAALLVTAAGAVAAVVRLRRHRPAWTVPGRPVPPSLRAATALATAFAAFLAGTLLLSGDGGPASRATVFPEPLSPFTAFSFGAFFAALVAGRCRCWRRARSSRCCTSRAAWSR